MISYLSKKCKAFACINGNIVKIKKGYICENGELKKMYSAGNIVTYNVDTNVSYKEEVDSDESVLNPTSFVPTKSGYTFVGWREDTVASGSVLSGKVMGDEPITLYAVFAQDVKLSCVANGATSVVTKQKYYNYGNNAYPTFTIASPTKSGSTFKGWSASPSSTTVSWSNITNLTIANSTTIYAVFTYNTLTYSIYSASDVGFGKGRYNFYADYSKYYQMYVTNSNPGGMHGVRVYPSNNEYDLLINLSGEGAASGYINSWTTGELQLLAYSNYANSFTTGTVYLYGRTVVG